MMLHFFHTSLLKLFCKTKPNLKILVNDNIHVLLVLVILVLQFFWWMAVW